MAYLVERPQAGQRHATTTAVLSYSPTRGDAWEEPEGQIAPAVWLGAFPMHTPQRCQAKCGGMAIARATWIYRGKLIAVVLCLPCCIVARDHKHPSFSVEPPRLPTERRPTRATDPGAPRINGMRRKPTAQKDP